jgi:chloride channel protein, CIC family
VPTQRDSPVHRDTLLLDALKAVRVRDLLSPSRPAPITFLKDTPTSVLLLRASEAAQQDVFPVVDASGRMIGLITSASLRVLALEQRDATWALAADIMEPPVWVRPEDDLRLATERLLANGMRELPVLDAEGKVLGILDEAEVARLHVQAAARVEEPSQGF